MGRVLDQSRSPRRRDAPLSLLGEGVAWEAGVRRLSGGLRFPLRVLVPDALHWREPILALSHSALGNKTYAMAMLKTGYRDATKKNMPKRWFDDLPHTHAALDDAIEQGALFCNMLREHMK